MGNGNIGVSVNLYPHEIKFILAKNDIWDARSNADPEKYALKHDDLIRLVKEKDKDLFNIWEVGKEKADYIIDCHDEADRRMPNPKRACCVRLFHPGLSDTIVEAELHLKDGVLETVFHFAKGRLIVRAFAEKGCNRFWLQAEADGEVPWFIFVAEKEPDDSDTTIPLPILKEEGERMASISQTIPAGFGFDDFSWTTVVKFPETSEGVEAQWLEYKAWRVRQYCGLAPGKSTCLCLAIATDRDGTPGDSRTRAKALVSEQLSYETALSNHQSKWEKYWETSYISLDDKELEALWYRNHFGYGCAIGDVPIGSGGNVIIQDSIPWNGDCHMNHNFQKWYCTALATNHAEWMELYADFIRDKLPIFEYQAQLIFGLEGAYCDISYFPFMVKEHCNIINHVGRALAVTGWVGAPLWQHWEYMRDINWLRERAYPYLKAAAKFYYNYLEKYSDSTGEIYPSIRLEEPGWTKDFVGCRNVITDLCMFKKAFDYAIYAAEILDTDDAWRKKWTEARAKVPKIEHGIDENGNGWIALDKDWPNVEPERRADESRYSRWGGGGWIVYPGEYVPGDGDDSLTEALRDMLRKTDLMNPFVSSVSGKNMYPGVPVIHPISSLVPAIRLGLKEHFDSIKQVLSAHRLTYGQTCSYMLAGGSIPKEVNSGIGYMWYDWRSVENKYAAVLAITEMLLQSQGGVIRLFPFIPEDIDASFFGFRAAGGFVISAVRIKGKIKVTLLSESGETALFKTSKNDVMAIPTEAGEVCELEVTYG
jgi:hypothetical protein